MALSAEELNGLAAALTEALGELPPQPMELVCATGELFSTEALALARVYDAATNGQRNALDQIAEALKACPPRKAGKS